MVVSEADRWVRGTLEPPSELEHDGCSVLHSGDSINHAS